MDNPGKYDLPCTFARIITHAKGVLLIILEGDKGNGFEVQCAPEMVESIPRLLRDMADSIEKDPGEITHVIDLTKPPTWNSTKR
jgi:hypothetical protein